jgi:hypothetical protein
MLSLEAPDRGGDGGATNRLTTLADALADAVASGCDLKAAPTSPGRSLWSPGFVGKAASQPAGLKAGVQKLIVQLLARAVSLDSVSSDPRTPVSALLLPFVPVLLILLCLLTAPCSVPSLLCLPVSS